MSRSLKSLASKRGIIIAVVLVAVIILLARPFGNYAHSRALATVRRGDSQSDANKSLVWYRVADVLAPHDPRVLDTLAKADIQTNHDKAALTAATRAIDHGAATDGYVLKSQAFLELGQTDAATTAAETAVQRSTNYQTAQLQLGLCYAATENNDKLGQMIALLGSQEPAKTLIAVQHNHFALAQQLYVTGLLNSSERVLDKYQIENSDYYQLKARITLQLSHDSQKSLETSRGLLEKGIAISPERIDLRQLLQTIDTKLGDTSAASQQGSKIKALLSGQV